MNYKYLLILPVLFFLSCQKENLASLDDSFTVRRDGADMPAYVYGNATNKTFLVYLHGGPGGNGLNIRSGWHQKVEDEYAIVYWDQRGSGMSQGHLSEDNLGLEEMIKDVSALVQVLKHKYGEDSNLFLMGHSWGGLLGNAFLTTDNGAPQNLFKGWINASAGYAWCPLWEAEVDNFKAIAEAQIAEGNEVDYWESGIELADDIDIASCMDFRLNTEGYKAEEVLQKSGVINPHDTSVPILQSVLFKNNQSVTSKNLVNTNRFFDTELITLDLTEDLPMISLPTLVLQGKYDFATPHSVAVSFYENIGSIEKKMVTFENSGHQPHSTEPDIFAAAVLDFMELYK